jgi:hypothetical protein
VYTEELATRYPHRKSVCGRLLAEIVHSSVTENRTKALYFYGPARYKSGFRRLAKIADSASQNLEVQYSVPRPNRELLNAILFVFGWMDTEKSHAYLVNLLNSDDADDYVKGDVLEAMAFEKRNADPDLVDPFLDATQPYPILTSAIYFFLFHRPSEQQLRKLVPLTQQSSYAGNFAVEILLENEKSGKVLAEMAVDPDDTIREIARNCVAAIDAEQEARDAVTRRLEKE